MLALRIVPKINYFDTVQKFHDEFAIGKDDLLVTNKWIYEPYIKPLNVKTNVIFQEEFGSGEPSDEMIDQIFEESKKYDYKRIIALGGGTIIDICKILSLEIPDTSTKLFTGEVAPKKVKELVAVPTTCGTGSEVTNVAVAELKKLKIKKGLAVDETYASQAVLIPETMDGLPFKFFMTSSVDALIHAVEAYLSPKASEYTDLFGLKAIEMIMKGYREIIEHGEDVRFTNMKDFVLASNYAGISLVNAGAAAVHALSYSIGGAFHVPHGEANYQFFTEVLKMYVKKDPNGKIAQLTQTIADIIGVDINDDVYGAMEEFLNKLIEKKKLREYGMTEKQIDEFTQSTIDNQQRLLNGNYVYLSEEDIREIFENLY